MCLMLANRHSLTWEATTDTLKLINRLFNNTKAVPETKYKLLQHIQLQTNCMKFHYYCRTCKKYLGEQLSSTAGESVICDTWTGVQEESNTSYFVTLGLQSQIRQLLENREVVSCISYRFKRKKINNESIEDIYDGRMYRILSSGDGPLTSKWNLSYTFNTDGCQAGNSSKVTVWPIYAMINELPPEIRSKHMILIGLWADKSEPNMNLFMLPFVNEANILSTEGIQWHLDDKTIITSLIISSVCIVDSIARADVVAA